VLRSSDVLQVIQQLQQLSRSRSHSLTPTQTRRWAQLGTLWRQVLTQWLLLESQLQLLPAPLPQESMQLLAQHLDTSISSPAINRLLFPCRCGETGASAAVS